MSAGLAGAYGVATWYEDTRRQRVEVADEVVVAELGVDAASPAARRAALAQARERAAGLPDPLVVRQGSRPVVGRGELTTEDGAAVPVHDRLPADLPLGWHRLSTQDRL